MKKMIVIIDLHCDASMPPGAMEFGGGNKYSRNLISILLSENIPFLYFTHKKLPQLEEILQLAPNTFFYRIELENLGVNDKDFLQNYKTEVINYIKPVLEEFKEFRFIFHSIYWSSGEIACYFSIMYKTFFVHTILSNGKSKEKLGAIDDLVSTRCETEQKVFEQAKFIICSSQSEATDIQQFYHISSDKLVVTGRWVEKEFLFPFHDLSGSPQTYSFNINMPSHYLENTTFSSAQEKQITWWLSNAFIYVGRIHKNKGVPQIIEAWQRLYKKYKEKMPCLWIVGGIPEDIDNFRQKYISNKPLLEEAEKAHKIIWWGTLPPEGISTLMLKCLAFVAHSKYEAGGNVVLEAMAHALPVIATPYGYAKDYIKNGENGYLVSYDDIDTLSTCMDYFIKQPYLSNYMGRSAKKDLNNIIENWNFAKLHLQLYEEHSHNISKNHIYEKVPLDSVDIYPHKLLIPDDTLIYELITQNTNLIPIKIQNKNNAKNYFLWEIETLSGICFFYYLYSVLNRNSLNDVHENYIITKYQRIKKIMNLCYSLDFKILFVDKTEGYILLDHEVEI